MIVISQVLHEGGGRQVHMMSALGGGRGWSPKAEESTDKYHNEHMNTWVTYTILTDQDCNRN